MSDTISRSSGSPTSMSGSPDGTTDSLSRKRCKTTPVIGDRRMITSSWSAPAAPASIRLVRARSSSNSTTTMADSAARTASLAVTARRRASSRRLSAVRPSACSFSCLASSTRAWSSSALARSRSTRACSTCASLRATLACASARVLEFRNSGRDGRNRARIVELARTASPGSCSIRSTLPSTGADTT